MRISDWSSDVCSADLVAERAERVERLRKDREGQVETQFDSLQIRTGAIERGPKFEFAIDVGAVHDRVVNGRARSQERGRQAARGKGAVARAAQREAHDILREQRDRGERAGHEIPFERQDRKSTRPALQSLMRISYAVFCLKNKKTSPMSER